MYRPIIAGDKDDSEDSNTEFVYCFCIDCCWMQKLLLSSFLYLSLDRC